MSHDYKPKLKWENLKEKTNELLLLKTTGFNLQKYRISIILAISFVIFFRRITDLDFKAWIKKLH